MGFTTVNREQSDLIGYSLSDFVPADAKARFAVEVVSELDLKDLYNGYSRLGANALDPQTMLATWFFAYSEGVTSTRRLEELCKRDTHFIYVSGNLRPDHTSLSRFRQANLELLSECFIQMVHLSIEKGIADFKSVATDGTKIQASGSRKQSKDSDQLSRQLASVREDIKEYMKRCEADDSTEINKDDDLKAVREKLEKLQELEKQLVERQEKLEDRKQTLKPEHRAKHKINLTEPDAPCMSHVNGNQSLPAYNAQITVDTKTRIIGACDVVQDRNDQNQFSVQHQAIEENVGKDPQRQHNNDAGYHSLDQLEYIGKNQIDAVVADPTPENRSNNSEQPSVEKLLEQGQKLKRTHFVYHVEQDYYRCPAGAELHASGSYKKGISKGRVYQKKDCHDCPLVQICLSKKNTSGIKRIYRDDREIYAEGMRKRLQTDAAKERMKLRATTVEPVFGTLKENLGFRRFRLRGLENARGEFALMCIAYNINKLYKLLSDLITSPEAPDPNSREEINGIFAAILISLYIMFELKRSYSNYYVRL
jgi:transposase